MPTADNSQPDLINPQTGDRLWFEQLPNGASQTLTFRCEIPARSPGTPLHFHRTTDECFECVTGELSMIAGKQHICLKPGMTVDIPRNTPHRFWNATDAPTTFRSSATPGHAFEQFLRTVYGLGIDGKSGTSGMPSNPLEVAVIRELADLYFAGVPLFVQQPLFATLSWLASITQTRARLEKYWKRP